MRRASFVRETAPRQSARADPCRPLAERENLREVPGVKNLRLILFLVAAVLSVRTLPAQAKPGWLTSYEEAEKEVKAGNKLLLVDFTGSDWCGWCMKIDKEIFSKPAFKEYAAKNLVLLEIDFPRRREVPEALKIQNTRLAEKYEIQGFPTIIVLNGAGKKVGELGYVEGGPAAFIAELEKLPKS
jgi:thioredoxin-related protein